MRKTWRFARLRSATYGAMAAIILASSLISAQAQAQESNSNYVGFKNPVKGIEYGIERQQEFLRANHEKVVQRTYGRAVGTLDWQVYKDPKGSTVDVGVKGGLLAGQYKGSMVIADGYGSHTEFRGGAIGELAGTYTYNTSVVDPYIGLRSEIEFTSRPRTEWQIDAVSGLRFNVADDKDLSVQYNHTLAHGFDYHKKGKTPQQDDGYAISLIGTKRTTDTASHSIKLTYEHFKQGDVVYWVGGAGAGYEPDTDNWLLAYQRTF